jgi:glycosyltransferase involved in cell wall biosynthesis
MKRRIAIDGRVALHPRTGFGSICHNVMRRIAAVDNQNSYFFYFDRDPGTLTSEYPAQGYAYGGSSEEIIWCNTFLPRQLKRDGIDVYLTFLDKEIPFFPRSAKVISMVHDLKPMLFPEVWFRNLAHKLYYNAMLRVSLRRSNLILTNSEHSRQEIVSTLSVDPHKIRKIALGVEAAPPASESAIAAVLQRYHVTRPYVLALGSTQPHKNNSNLIRAFRLIEKNFPSLCLVIGGVSWRGREFDPELLDDRVILAGFIGDGDLPVLLQAAELFAFPSLHEGFGLPMIEAMAAGVPVITSNVTALPEVGGDAALYVDPASVTDLAEKMELVLTHRDLAAEMKRKGLIRAQSFQWETTCREIAAACMELCNGA